MITHEDIDRLREEIRATDAAEAEKNNKHPEEVTREHFDEMVDKMTKSVREAGNEEKVVIDSIYGKPANSSGKNMKKVMAAIAAGQMAAAMATSQFDGDSMSYTCDRPTFNPGRPMRPPKRNRHKRKGRRR